jgi:hypothetical protein
VNCLPAQHWQLSSDKASRVRHPNVALAGNSNCTVAFASIIGFNQD